MCFFRFANLDLIILVLSPARTLKVNLPLEKKSSPTDCSDSRSVFSVNLGLHPYLQDGGRSCLEIKVEFHEGAVSLSALHSFY